MSKIIIEICPFEPRASACLASGDEISTDPTIARHLADCTGSGDAEPACLYVLDHIGVEFRIVAQTPAGKYENRIATPEEKEATCRAIYFDSESDFSDERLAETYLVWEAANSVEEIETCRWCGRSDCFNRTSRDNCDR